MIDSENNQLGIVPIEDALKMSYEQEFDLVEISPKSKPPVCKLLDFGKYLYEKQKKERQAKKKQKQVLLKELKLRPLTEPHDVEFKVNHARKFLEEGNKVKFTVRFKGREIVHKELAAEKLIQIAELLADISEFESKPVMQGKIMQMVLTKK